MDRLQALTGAGVSIWLDTLSRDLLEEGRFSDLIATGRVTGATSNPTIFASAITGSDRYDAQLRRLLDDGVTDLRELFFALAVEDVRRAADLLRPVFDRTRGRDGFVSLECTPDVAHDTAATAIQARKLWRRLDRPNVMIKVPATDAGMGAVAELTSQGVNVNVTLLFSLERYGQTIQACKAGLRQCRRAGRSAPASSVASFFVSRVDGKADAILPAGSDLRGKVAVANARRAYALYLDAFAGEDWEQLSGSGARAQRPLWASTSGKNPAYSDVLYVEELIGPDVINTMTEKTIAAFADHGRVGPTLGRDTSEADRIVSEAAGRGVDLAVIGSELEREGIDAFAVSYRRILECIDERVRRLQGAGAGDTG